ncbi:hypothetical protein VKT23_011765 [Stygiomarasmius scandens]|uniref:DUF1772-domain-containing protein n=1 Tax=Marasmiellus scandens TaxID=2682957 RepID=A0ABR1J8G6_9AGAR
MSLSTGPSGIRIAQALGIAGSAFVSGAILSISYIATPAILDYPFQVASQWDDVYTRGSHRMPPLALLSTGAYAYAAYTTTSTDKARLFTLAALFTIGIVPYTFGTMLNTNNQLKRKIQVAEKDEETIELVKKWKLLNAGRGLLPLVGSVLGIMGLLM